MAETPLSVAVVDDDATILTVLGEVLGDAGYHVVPFAAAEPCLDAIRQGGIDFVFSDINMPGMSGVQLLQTIKQLNEDIEVVMMTADARVESAIEATRHGAFDYLQKPFADVDLIAELAGRVAAKVQDRRRERAILSSHAAQAAQTFRLEGTLEETPLHHAMQVIADMGRDGILVLDGPPSASLYIQKSQLLHVEIGAIRGRKALYRLLRGHAGVYRLTPYVPPAGGETMKGEVSSFVLDGMRRKDEYEKVVAQVPSLEQKWSLMENSETRLAQLAPWLIGVMADILRADKASVALDNPDYFDLDILKGIQYLWQNGAIRPGA